MAIVPINLTGGEHKHKSRPLTRQETRNFWPQIQGTPKARSPYILQSFYGLKQWSNPGVEGVCRGAIVNQGTLYKVTGIKLYSVSSDGTHTALGTIPGYTRCIIENLGSQVIVNNGSGFVYVWDGSTLTENTSANIGSPNGVAVLNNQAIYDAGSGQGFDVSDAGDPLTIDGLNNAQAESASDDLIIPYAYRETLYLLGDRTIELWWNSGQGNPPFDKIQGAIINTGLEAKYSIDDNTDFIFLLGNDKQFYTLTPGTSSVATVISTPTMAKEIQGYSKTNDCIGWTMELEGQWFYIATFPTEDITWAWPIGGEWFKWGSTATGRIRANSYVNIYDKHLVGDYNSSKIYELDPETYTDAGETIIRSRISAPFHAGLINQHGKSFEINSLEIDLETSVGLTSGQGEDPLLVLELSRDGGKTFGTKKYLRVGRLNERITVRTSSLGRFDHDCVFKISTSDPIYWAIYGAVADVEVCI